MANNTSVQRVQTTDSTDSLSRRKQKSDQINVSQASFFNELLNLSKFESKIQQAQALNDEPLASALPASKKSDDSTTNEAPTSEADDTPEPEQTAGQDQAYAAQVSSQQTAINNLPTSAELKPTQTQESVATAEKSIACHDGTLEQTTNVQNTNTVAVDTSNDSSDTANTKASTADQNTPVLTANKTGKAEKTQVQNQETQQTKPIAETHSDISGKKTVRDKKTEESTEKNARPATAQSVEKTAASSTQVHSTHSKNESSSQKNTKHSEDEVKISGSEKVEHEAGSETRNRRAERLAERAQSSDSGDDSTNSNSAGSSELKVEPIAGPAVETPDTSAFTISASADTIAPTTTSAPIAAILPTAPLATTTSTTTASTDSSAKAPVISSVSSVASSSSSSSNTTVTSSSTTTNTTSQSESKPQAARTNAGTSITPYQEVKLVQRVLRGLEQLGDGGGQVKLRLHPPELGSLQLSMRMESGQMFAKLEVENTAARDALVNNLQTLKDRLSEQGIKVQSFDVQVTADSTSSGSNGSNLQQNGNPNSNSAWENATSRFAQLNNNRLSSDAPPERTTTPGWSRTNGSLDLTV